MLDIKIETRFDRILCNSLANERQFQHINSCLLWLPYAKAIRAQSFIGKLPKTHGGFIVKMADILIYNMYNFLCKILGWWL